MIIRTTKTQDKQKWHDKIGNLNPGSYANFLITSGKLFEKKTILHENWIQGNKNVISAMDIPEIAGKYDLKINNSTYELHISGKGNKQKGQLKKGG